MFCRKGKLDYRQALPLIDNSPKLLDISRFPKLLIQAFLLDINVQLKDNLSSLIDGA